MIMVTINMMTIMMTTMMMITMTVQFSGSLDPGLVSQQRTQPTACHRSRHDDGDDNDDDNGDDDDDNYDDEEADSDDDIGDEVSKPRVRSVEGLDRSGFQILTLSKVLDSRFLSDKNKLASFEGILVWKYDRPTDQPSH